jgi:cholesterol transport system auxiliary component
MVRAVLVEAFENSKAVGAVGPDTLDLRADFEIDGDLRHFEAVYDSPGAANGAPTVWVALAVKLVKVPEHKILAQTLISAREPAAANATPQIVEAFNRAMGSVAKQVVVWTLTNPALSTSRR